MENSKLYPFERNRFYSGKLLASADFEAEQVYFNDKRRFLNKMLYGAGIVSGMQVSGIDDFSIMLETGLALDNRGREIVVGEAAVKRLSTIQGFSKTTTNKLALCIAYHEEQTTPVHTINEGEQACQYNRIMEGYRLILRDNASYSVTPEAELEFLHSRIIYEDDDYRVWIEIPKYISPAYAVCPVILIQKLSDGEEGIVFKAVMQTPAFETEGGKHELQADMSISADTLAKGEKISYSYKLTPRKDIGDKAVIMVKASAVNVVIGDKSRRPDQDIIITMNVESGEPQEIIRKRVADISLEKHFESAEPGYLKIAEIALSRNADTYIIDEVSQRGCVEKLYTSLQNVYVDRFRKYFDSINLPVQNNHVVADVWEAHAAEITPHATSEELYTTGTVEIPLSMGSREGEVFYSDPVMHRLGLGNVFAQVGLEFVKGGGESSRITVYGEAALFCDSKGGIPAVQTAVRLDASRGTFTVAVKLLERTDAASLVMRWFAMRLPNTDTHTAVHHEGKSIFVTPATITVAPKESYCIQIGYENMPQEVCRFEVVGKDAGRVTEDGIYTAPAIEGVYEVKVSVINEPNVFAYAYIVVRAK